MQISGTGNHFLGFSINLLISKLSVVVIEGEHLQLLNGMIEKVLQCGNERCCFPLSCPCSSSHSYRVRVPTRFVGYIYPTFNPKDLYPR